MINKLLISLFTVSTLSLSACNQSNQTQSKVPDDSAEKVELKIGDQKGNMRAQLEASHLLEGIHYSIKWYEFPAAAPVAEALNVNGVDLGYLGDAPFIFANADATNHAGGAKAIAVNQYDPYAVAILVPKDSPIKSILDLKGKTVTANKGSIGQLITLRALERAGMKATDVEFKHLPPADGKLAVAHGSVDAWAVWDPYTAYAEVVDGFRIIENGRGIYSGFTFLAGTSQALNDPAKRAAIQDFIYRLDQSQKWANTNYKKFGKELARITGIPEQPSILAFERKKAQWLPISDEIVKTSQQTADYYVKYGLLKNKIDVNPLFDRGFNTVKETTAQ